MVKVSDICVGASLESEEYSYLVFLIKGAIDGLEDALQSSPNSFSNEFFAECRHELGLANNLLDKFYPDDFRNNKV